VALCKHTPYGEAFEEADAMRGSFYYAWESRADGLPAGNDVDGPAHAQIYWDLVQKSEQGPHEVLFVKGENGAEATIQPDLAIAQL
jgi:hypothetical protein